MQTLSLIGIFHNKSPGRDAVQKIVNGWPKKCRTSYHDSSWIVFTFEQIEDLDIVMQEGPYYAFGKPLMLRKMPKFFNFSKEACSIVPIWIQLRNLPLVFWNEKYLNKICTYVGKPQYTDKLTANRGRISFARCLVKVDVGSPMPSMIPITLPGGTVLQQHVLYEDIPKFCSECRKLEHNVIACDDSFDDVPQIYVNRKKRQEHNKKNNGKKTVAPVANLANAATPPDAVASVQPAPVTNSAPGTISSRKNSFDVLTPNDPDPDPGAGGPADLQGTPSTNFTLNDVVFKKLKSNNKKAHVLASASRGSSPHTRKK